ncbi:MAG: hypothetical protein JRI25_18515, partial [Deltaproteobacteria bacterium]|nr:hypothetical protein [Deltaproteobacteria bacterium]
MHRTLPLFALLVVACAGADSTPPPADGTADLDPHLAQAERVLAQVQPWNGADAARGLVAPSALAAVAMPFHRSDAAVAIYLTAEGHRAVGDQHLEPGRAPLCGALALPSPTPAAASDGGDLTVRAHIAATARASEAAELLIDLQTCGGHRVDLVFRRDPQPDVMADLLEKAQVPETFLTVLPVRLSPEEAPFQIKQGERWERAAQR